MSNIKITVHAKDKFCVLFFECIYDFVLLCNFFVLHHALLTLQIYMTKNATPH